MTPWSRLCLWVECARAVTHYLTRPRPTPATAREVALAEPDLDQPTERWHHIPAAGLHTLVFEGALYGRNGIDPNTAADMVLADLELQAAAADVRAGR